MMRDVEGFTLIELLVVLVVVGILAAVALPRYSATLERSRQAEAISILGSMRGAQLRHAAENSGAYATTWPPLDIDQPVGRYFTYDVINTQAGGSNIAEATRNGVQVVTGVSDSDYKLIINSSGDICCNIGDNCASSVPQCS